MRDMLTEAADLAEARRQAIPEGCSCTWGPRFSTLPATWLRAETEPGCKVHGELAEVTP